MNRKLVVLALGSFVVGAVVMLAFDSPLARVVGMTCLIGFVVAGLFVVITPEFLEPGESDAPGRARSDSTATGAPAGRGLGSTASRPPDTRA